MKPITLEEAKNLKHGDILYIIPCTNKKGEHLRIRITGKVKTWKTRPNLISVPWKHGLYDYGHLTQDTLSEFSLESK